MGSVAFIKEGLVGIVHGLPESVKFPASVVQFAPSADRKGRYAQMPDDLRRMHRAMQIAVPPEEFVVSVAGQTGLKETIQKIFGSGQRDPTETEWHPTSLVENGARAWVRHQRWQEGGGENWIGSPIYNDWAVAGAFIRDAELRQWADELFEHPLGKLIEADTGNGCVYSGCVYTADTDPRSWPGVKIESESFSFFDTGDYSVKNGKAQPGVHRTYRVQWGLWLGEVSVYLPEYWQIKTETEWEQPVCYPFRIARNGREEKRFAPPYTSLETDRQFVVSGDIGGRQVVEYSTELPNLAEFIPPTEAGGDYATCWPSLDDWQDFARRHNIRAEKPFLGLHSPNDSEPGAAFVPLTKEFADLAWTQGATPVPVVIGEVPPKNQWEFRGSTGNSFWDRSYFRVGLVQGFCFGQPKDGESDIYMSEGGGNCEKYHRGWVRVPADRKVKGASGLTVRDVGDKLRGFHETVVYTDGRVQLAEK